MTHEFGEPPRLRPIDQLNDIMLSKLSILDRSSDAYYALSVALSDKITMQGAAGVGVELHDDMIHHLALREMLRPRVLGSETAARVADSESEAASYYDDFLAPHGMSMASMQEHGSQLTSAEVVDYFLGRLESYTAFLETDRQPTNWPEAIAQGGLLGNQTSQTVQTTAELVRLCTLKLQEELGEDAAGIVQRQQAWLQRTCRLLLSKQRVGLAIPLIDTATTEEETTVLSGQLAQAMDIVRSAEGERNYRRLYSFAARIFSEPHRTAFLAQNERVDAPPIYGAQREVLEHGVLVERFEEGMPTHAKLANGEPVILPYSRFTQRILTEYGQPTESEMYELQTTVRYGELDDLAKRALAKAETVSLANSSREETLPDYRRLALKPGKGMNDTLHTVSFRDGFRRTLERYPDDHGFTTSETEPQIDNPVASLQAVMDSYIVLPYDGGYTSQTTIRDTDPNFFGPGEDKANAFWISGNPRIVIGQLGEQESQWVIMPVRFYQITEERQPLGYEDEGRFFGR